MSQSVRELTRAVASGDAEAFERFYRAWFDRMYAEARRSSGRGESDCMDIVQEAMLRVIRAMKPMDEEAALRAWVVRVVRSCAIDHLRRESRRLRRERDREAPASAAPAEAPRIEARLRWLRGELARLDDDAGALLAMRHRFGLTLAQIGSVTGLAPGAVDGRLRRIVTGLRRRAKEHDDG